MKISQWLLPILISASTFTSMPLLASTNTNNSSESTRIIAATVNNRPIYIDQLTYQLQSKIDKYKRFNRGAEPSDSIKKKMQEEVLKSFINIELIYQASQKQKVTNLEQKIKQQIDKQNSKHLDSTENTPLILDQKAIKQQILIDEYLKQHNLLNPQLPEDELKAFYEKNKQQFASKTDTVHVQHILMADKQELEKVRQLIIDGMSFADAATQYSTDANSINGGDLGFIERTYMPKAFNDIAFTIKKNSLSEIIKTKDGYHILQVLKKNPAGTIPSFEKMKDFLAKGFAPKVKSNNTQQHLSKLRNNADIEILLP